MSPAPKSYATGMILLLVLACSGDGKKDDESGAPAAAPAPAPEATLPVDVAGSFLAGCSAATGPTYVNDSAVSANLTACVVRDKDGKEVAVATPSVTVTTASTTVSPALVAKETAHAWSLGFTTTPEVLATLREIRIEFKTADGKAGVAVTDNAAFDWSKDPAFIGAMEFITSIHEIGSPADVYDENGLLATLRGAAIPHHLLFSTDAVFPADIGEAAADAYCDTAGQRLDPGARFVALLSTTARHAKDKIVIGGDVFQYNGIGISIASNFWSFGWHTSLRTETGLRVERRTVKESPPFFSLDAWTGTKQGGVLAEAEGTCADWTSREAAATGYTWRLVTQSGKNGAEHAATACSRRARLVCMSLWPRGR